MKNRSGFVKDIVLTMGGQLAVMLVSFGINKILSIYLATQDFGIYNVVKRAAGVVTYVMLVAMGIAVPKYISEYREKKDLRQVAYISFTSFFIVVVSCIFSGAILWICKTSLSKLLFGSETYINYMAPMIFFAAGTSFVTYTYSYFRGNGNFYKYSLYQIIVQIMTLTGAVLFGKNVQFLYWVWGVISFLFTLVALGPSVHEHIRVIGKPDKKESLSAFRELLRYGIPRVPGEFVLFAFNLLPLTIVTRNFGLNEAAYFSAAISINSMITPMFGFVGIVLLPIASRSVVNKDVMGMKRKIRFLMILYCTVSVGAILLLQVVPETAVYLLFSEKYIGAVEIIKIVCLALLPNALYLLLRNPLDGISKFPYNTCCLLLSFVFTYIFMLRAKTIEMCAAAYVTGYIILGILVLFSWGQALKKTERECKEERYEGKKR